MTEPRPTNAYAAPDERVDYLDLDCSGNAVRRAAYATPKTFTPAPVDEPPDVLADVLAFFVNLRRDLLRKVHDLDILIARLQKLQKAQQGG